MPVSHDKTESYPSLPEVVHELRNRLGVMRNALYCLENLPLPSDEAQKYFQTIRAQILQAEKLIADLMDAGRSATERN